MIDFFLVGSTIYIRVRTSYLLPLVLHIFLNDIFSSSDRIINFVKYFQTNVEHPHKHLLHHLKSIKEWISPEVWDRYDRFF